MHSILRSVAVVVCVTAFSMGVAAAQTVPPRIPVTKIVFEVTVPYAQSPITVTTVEGVTARIKVGDVVTGVTPVVLDPVTRRVKFVLTDLGAATESGSAPEIEEFEATIDSRVATRQAAMKLIIMPRRILTGEGSDPAPNCAAPQSGPAETGTDYQNCCVTCPCGGCPGGNIQVCGCKVIMSCGSCCVQESGCCDH